MKTTKYKVGQSVVHLSYGIGTVKSIERREFSPNKVSEFYILEIIDNGTPKKVFVPIEGAEARLRPVMNKKTALSVLKYIELGKDTSDIDHQTWNRRYRDYMELVHSGDAMQIAKVYVALQALRADKELSFGERKLLEQARELLTKELDAVGLSLPK